jgi:hypothetical protein
MSRDSIMSTASSCFIRPTLIHILLDNGIVIVSVEYHGLQKRFTTVLRVSSLYIIVYPASVLFHIRHTTVTTRCICTHR